MQRAFGCIPHQYVAWHVLLSVWSLPSLLLGPCSMFCGLACLLLACRNSDRCNKNLHQWQLRIYPLKAFAFFFSATSGHGRGPAALSGSGAPARVSEFSAGRVALTPRWRSLRPSLRSAQRSAARALLRCCCAAAGAPAVLWVQVRHRLGEILPASKGAPKGVASEGPVTRGRLGSPALLRIGKEVGQVLCERTLRGALAPFSGMERMRRLTD